MIIEIKNCVDCPCSNIDNECGRDTCYLMAIVAGKNENLFSVDLPHDKRHKDCPIGNGIKLVAGKGE